MRTVKENGNLLGRKSEANFYHNNEPQFMCQTGESFLEWILQEDSTPLRHGGNAERKKAYGLLPDSVCGFICFMLRVAPHLGYHEIKGFLTIFGQLVVSDQMWCKGEELVGALAQSSGACCKVPSKWQETCR